MKRTVFFAAIVAGSVYFLDRQNGNRRRRMAVDRTAGFFRRRLRQLDQGRRSVAAAGSGFTQKSKHLREEEKPQPNDATLKAKVESEVFRDERVPKGKVDVNAEDGVVYLRGEVDSPDLVAELEKATRKVHGVREVENLLHTAEGKAS